MRTRPRFHVVGMDQPGRAVSIQNLERYRMDVTLGGAARSFRPRVKPTPCDFVFISTPGG